jgi:pSer/pThr/pTyr-binding forkhead associated (FHA) protein
MAEGDQYFFASGTGEKIELVGELAVGRSAESDLVVSEGQPSRRHAIISVQDDGVYVEDLESTNGTFVNGDKVAGKTLLAAGDEVAFDINKFKFEVQSAAPAGDATVLREVVDPNRTVLRSMPTLDPPAEEAAPATPEPEQAAEVASPPEPAPPPEPEQPPEPAPPPTPALAPEPEPPKAVKPGSWADPNEKNASSTQFFSPQDLAAMRGASIEEKVESDVPFLQVTSGSAAGSVIQLIPEGNMKEWSIGNHAGRDIRFDDQGVSDFHTILVHENGRWKVVDQMSTNGTFVNGSKTISGYLNSGDKIRIGTVECSFVLPGGAAATRQATPGATQEGNKTVIAVVSFVLVLAVMSGVYYFLM